jgi:hypothetical protein
MLPAPLNARPARDYWAKYHGEILAELAASTYSWLLNNRRLADSLRKPHLPDESWDVHEDRRMLGQLVGCLSIKCSFLAK